MLGFVGNTGDAQGTPFHLHFEVHPVQLLGLGYDGAVDPTKYLDAWRRLQDVRFDAVTGWTPRGGVNAPKAGRDPAALERHLVGERARSGLAPRARSRPSRRRKEEAEGCTRKYSRPPRSR